MNNTIKLGNFISEYSIRNRAGDDIPVYSVTNKEGFCRDYFSKDVASQDRSTYKIVPRGCFAYNPSRINVGSVDWQRKEDRVIVSPLYVVFSVSKGLDQQYLYYYLKSEKCLYYIKELASGSVRDNLKLSMLKEFTIPNITLEEQRKAVMVLEQTDRLIVLQERQMTVLDELVKSRFVEMFGEPVTNSKGYPIHQLSDHILFLTSGSRGWAQYYTDKGEWFITIKNVKDCRISVDDVQCINPPKNAEAERTRLREGDLLISITADLGRTGVVTKEIAEHGAYNNQHLTCIRLDRLALDPLYVAFFMESEAGKRQFEAKNMSAVKAGLNFDSIRSLRLIVPPLALQKEFDTFVAEVDKSKLAVKQSLEKLETLKKSLMQQYFG